MHPLPPTPVGPPLTETGGGSSKLRTSKNPPEGLIEIDGSDEVDWEVEKADGGGLAKAWGSDGDRDQVVATSSAFVEDGVAWAEGACTCECGGVTRIRQR